VVGTRCASSGAPGWTGPPFQGTSVAIVDEEGRELPAGELGSLAYRRPDPVMFLRYWETRPHAVEVPRRLADQRRSGPSDDQGYFRFVGRDDDLITSGGVPEKSARERSRPAFSRHPAARWPP